MPASACKTMCCGGGLGTATIVDRERLTRVLGGRVTALCLRGAELSRVIGMLSTALGPHHDRFPASAMKKVLIIEDYYALADIELLLCTMEGYEVRVAKSGDEVIERVHRLQARPGPPRPDAAG